MTGCSDLADDRDPRRLAVLLAGPVLAVALVVVAVAPLAVVLGASRLAVSAILATGAWVSVRRLGSVDLATGAAALAGAEVGGVLPALLGLPVVAGAIASVASGAVVTGAVVAVGARVGRTLSALTSLTVGIGAVAVVAAAPSLGGRAGFHAVPLVTGSDRGDLAVVLAALVVVLVAVWGWQRRRAASAAAVAVRAPHVAASLALDPIRAAATGGAVAGGILGLGGWLQATTSGSVIPAGFGLSLSAPLAMAALVGGGTAWSGALGALLVFGPATLLPTAPILGDAPVLVVGVLGLALLASRPGGLLGAPDAVRTTAEPGDPGPELAPAWAPAALAVEDLATPTREVSLRVEPGEIVAVVGPNGSGKSTLLARIAGQLPAGGTVRIGDHPAPAGAADRARRGIARTWQQPPDVDPGDGLAVAVRGPEGRSAARAVGSLLGDHAHAAHGRDLVRLAARRPRIALLDEPAAGVPGDLVVELLRRLAAGGTAVLIADHRREPIEAADRTVELPPPTAGTGRPRPAGLPRILTAGEPLTVGTDGATIEVAPGDVHLADGPEAGRVVDAVLAHRAGDVAIGGRELPRSLPARVRRGLGVVTDVRPPGDVTVRDHLAAVAGPSTADRLLADAPLLAGRGGDLTGVLSGGERRILAWLACLATAPRAVVLHHAGVGLDADALAWTDRVVAAWREADVPVLVAVGRPEERRWGRTDGTPRP